MAPRVDVNHSAIPIVILNWNGLDDTVRCVEHALALEGANFHIMVIDNGSSGSDFQVLAERFHQSEQVTVQKNNDNLGFARGMNKAIKSILNSEIVPSHIALLNNDAFVDPKWLVEMLSVADGGADAVTSCMRQESAPDKLDNAGHLFLNTGEVLPRGSGDQQAAYNQVEEVEGFCGGGCLLSTQMLAQIGVFDEFFSTGYEDAELGLRAILAGYRVVYCPSAHLSHKMSASIDKIRDIDYAVNLQVNIYFTYFKLMPCAVILFNFPWILLKTLLLLTVPLILGRWRLAKVQAIALWRFFKKAGHVFQARQLKPPTRLSFIEIIKRQTFFMPIYFRYFVKFILRGEQTVFEK